MKNMNAALLKQYNAKKFTIKQRLFEFKEKWHKSDEEVFAELAFCLCTPQSKAKSCDSAVSLLVKNRMLFSGSANEISKILAKKSVSTTTRRVTFPKLGKNCFPA